MPNIKFNYQYRDAANYKQCGSVIFRNPENLSPEFLTKKIRKKLIDEEFFFPSDLNVPQLVIKGFDYNPQLDHAWNEFISFEETTEEMDDELKRTVNEFIWE